MDNINIFRPALKIYIVGVVWWIWFFYQPFDWDRSVVLILFTIFFYVLYLKNFLDSENRLIYIVLTSPIFISISVIVVGVVWYLIGVAVEYNI